uniref:Uncharacterized protein n=1 Tax=Callithrix jacchus TaxID=9483 RepID=A0A5F4W9C3_CALJA
MFIAALLTVAKTWNQPKCPSMTDWTGKMWHIYTMEYYAAIKNDEFVSFVGTWMNLENIILSKLTQEQKMKYRIFSLIDVTCSSLPSTMILRPPQPRGTFYDVNRHPTKLIAQKMVPRQTNKQNLPPLWKHFLSSFPQQVSLTSVTGLQILHTTSSFYMSTSSTLQDLGYILFILVFQYL